MNTVNSISKALIDLTFTIPKPILEEVFKSKSINWRDTPVSLEQQINTLVVKARVLPDCNLVGGTEAMIPLDTLSMERVDIYSCVYRIPKSHTQGRSIMSVLSISFAGTSLAGLSGGLGGLKPQSVTPVEMAGMAMMDSFSPVPMTSTAKVQLIAENVVLVRDINPIISYGYLRCVLANDDEMNHIQIRSIPAFSHLVQLAVKSYIYNDLVVRMGNAYLSGGIELGVFKEKVDSYADSEEMYQTYLNEKWAKTAFMNDRETMNRYIKLSIGAMR